MVGVDDWRWASFDEVTLRLTAARDNRRSLAYEIVTAFFPPEDKVKKRKAKKQKTQEDAARAVRELIAEMESQ